MIGESPGGAIFGTKRVWKNSGMEEMAKEIGAPVVKLESSGVVKVNPPFGKKLKEFYIAKPILDADVVVSVPKFKVHGTMLLTGAIKNLLGTIPGIHKVDFHKAAPKPDEFGDVLSDILSVAKPNLAVMDAIVGMEGNGPTFGNPRKVGFVIASPDCVAMDAVVAEMMGIEPLRVYATKHAVRKGLGIGDLDNIEVAGVPLSEAKIPDWKLDFTSNRVVLRIPRFLLKLYGWGFKAYPLLTQRKCKSCRTCIENCPTGARYFESYKNNPPNSPFSKGGEKGDYPKVDFKKCIRCLQCFEVCPNRAVHLKFSYLAKHWLKSQAVVI